jgi:hypothetical protein
VRNNANVAQFSYTRSFSDALTRSAESMSLQSELCSRFSTVFSLLKALSADALDTAKQQNMLYRIVRLGQPDSIDSNWQLGLTNVSFAHFIQVFNSAAAS